MELNRAGNYIHFLGSMTDSRQKDEALSNAIFAVSLNQAGLSVLECFSRGVPFVTKKTAITGGERLAIDDGINGFLVEDEAEIVNILNLAVTNPIYFNELGLNAFKTYTTKWNHQNMVSKIALGINVVTNDC